MNAPPRPGSHWHPQADLKALSVVDYHQMRAAGTAHLLLDVREPWEAETARIEGGVLIPLGALLEGEPALPEDQPIVVMCHHGGRSARATIWLRALGYDAYNLSGGIDAWSTEVDRTVARY